MALIICAIHAEYYIEIGVDLVSILLFLNPFVASALAVEFLSINEAFATL